MKSAADFRKALDEAKNRSLDPVRLAVKDALVMVEFQMKDALAKPDSYSANPYFGDKMPVGAYYKGGYKDFIRLLGAELTPLGYIVEQSHDGGGMYSTYVVRMPEKRDSVVGPKRKVYGETEREKWLTAKFL
jgi:hypothetical protein